MVTVEVLIVWDSGVVVIKYISNMPEIIMFLLLLL